MPQSLSNIIVHTIFSTRQRTPFLVPELRSGLHAYMAAIARNIGCECYRAGGVEDHVHLAVRLSRTVAACDMVEKIKTGSSKWVKKQSMDLEGFAWQRGYAALSVSSDGLSSLCRYIDSQEGHHRKFTFMDEYRSLLKEYGIEFDERYMWD